jgi:predicted nuclease of predicted toxin-antitoxin system
LRFLVDENAGVVVSQWLKDLGYEVFSVYEQARGTEDDMILQKAFDDNWILITSDKDFGEKIYRDQRSHRGIIFLRLENESSTKKIEVLRRLLESYSDQISGNFVVVNEKQVRFARASS